MSTVDSREFRDVAYELKFLVDPDVGARIREWARARLEPDPYGQGPSSDEYLTTSLYFDTAGFDVLQRSGSYGRAKYRVRRYDGEPRVFLERKLRRNTRLCKRRTPVALDDLKLLQDPEADWAGAWFGRRVALRRLQPVCQIAYHRTARVAMRDTGRIRLTLDDDIRAVTRQGLAFADVAGGTLVSGERMVLELKYHVTAPAVFKQLVEEFGLDPQRISKYRLAAHALGFGASVTAGGREAGATYA